MDQSSRGGGLVVLWKNSYDISISGYSVHFIDMTMSGSNNSVAN